MTVKRMLAAAVAGLTPAALLFYGTFAFASTATTPTAKIEVPNITISSMRDVNVNGTLVNPSVLGEFGTAQWDMAQNANTSAVGSWLLYQGHTTDTGMTFGPGFSSLGTYHAYPAGASNDSGKSLKQNTVTFAIREASKTALKVTRSGSSLTILAGATYYDTGLDFGTKGAWVPYAGERITIYLWAGGKWKAWRTYPAAKNGNITPFTVKSAGKQKFYAATANGNIVWGNASVAVTR